MGKLRLMGYVFRSTRFSDLQTLVQNKLCEMVHYDIQGLPLQLLEDCLYKCLL